jgi:hypothetical protein
MREGMKVVQRFSDLEVSGGTTRRPGYQALLSAVHALVGSRCVRS